MSMPCPCSCRRSSSGLGPEFPYRVRALRHATRSRYLDRCRAPKVVKAHQAEIVERHVTIAGGGIAGLACAVAFHKVGIPCVVLEQGTELRAQGSAIGVWTNGWRALQALGIADTLRNDHPELYRIELCSSSGRLLRGFALTECDGTHEFRGVLRSKLLEALAAELPQGTIRFGAEVRDVSVDAATGTPTVTLVDGSSLRCSVLVGADGVQSAVAAALQLPAANYAGYVAYRGVAELGAKLPLPGDTCRQVFGRGVRAGMYPLSSSTCYWYTCFNAPSDAQAPTTPEQRKADALSRVAGWGSGILDCISATVPERISRSRITDRWVLPGYGRGSMTVAGDAAHPMTPNLGQGACVALEDAVVLARYMAAAGGLAAPPAVLQQALRQYEKERAARALPLTVRANLMGTALQIPLELVCTVRDTVVSTLFSPGHFLDHAMYDCGTLPVK